MDALVIYDSTFGNTAKIAQVIAGTIRLRGSVRLVAVGQVGILELEGIDLLVIGCPTQRHNATPAVRTMIESVPRGALRGVSVAAFDTRYRMPRWKSGSAARKLVRRLGRLGGSIIVPAGSFFVAGREGPLEEGEIERAEAWTLSILEKLEAQAVGEPRRRI